MGNITQEVIGGANPSTSSFAYDDLYRLSSATVNGTSYSYVYDQVGNRTSQTAGGLVTNYSFDSADHLTAVNSNAVTSDANGNITQDDSGALYTWDVRGRLVGLTKGGSSYAFTYGPDNLRVSKSVNGGVTTYLLDGDQVVTDTINGTANQTLYGPGTDHPLARNGEFFLPNHLNSTTGLSNGSGTLTQSYLYGPFGESLNTPSDSNPFQFTGRENDGDGLLYYRARYYNPFWGRFLSADPLGVGGLAYMADAPAGADRVDFADTWKPASAEGLLAGPAATWRLEVLPAGSANPFACADGNPVNATDPSGEITLPKWAQVVFLSARVAFETPYRWAHNIGTSGRVRPTSVIREAPRVPPGAAVTTTTPPEEAPGGGGDTPGGGDILGPFVTIYQGLNTLPDGIRAVVRYRQNNIQPGYDAINAARNGTRDNGRW